MGKLIVSLSPHAHGTDTVEKNMYGVIIALVPALLVSLIYFGLGSAIVFATSVLACVLFEWAIAKFIMKREKLTICDGSAILTGLLLGFNLPSNLPIWIIILGALVAIGVGKMTFGGLGQNVFNPAIAGRVFLLVSFPTYMTRWEMPKGLFGVDAVSGATPLGAIKEGLLQGASVPDIMSAGGYSYGSMLFANLGGSAGEISAIALLIGFVYLLVRKVIKPHITLSIWGTVALVSLIFWLCDPSRFTNPLFNLLTGGMILGSCFMATDYVTSPMTEKGGILFGVGIGFITLMIRYFGSYPEGMSFAILIMNAFVPLINNWFHHKKYGRA